MEHWRVEWLHDFMDEPIVIYSELGDDRYETRKIQKYRDGRTLKADESHEYREIGLSEIPLGSIDEVAQQPEFVATRITRGEFEAVWQQANWPS
ncbi:DUF6881 domain-containing protein [Streptomyces sp. NPDC058646]|uniref:DUF6881 domain-containing protein n=1 Tax=Streptomyces sp. NPDC058646 TaxID=3346574 RepID=UPI0036629A0B